MSTGLVDALEPRVWRLVMVATLGLVSAAMIAYLVWPRVEALRDANQTYAVLMDAVSNGERLSEEIESLRQVVATMDKTLGGDEADLPTNQLEGFVVGRMQQISWRHDVELRSIRPGAGSRVNVFDEVLFDIDVSGDYFAIFAWLEDLNEELGFVVVRQFNIRPLNSGRAGPVLVASFTMVAYRESEGVT